MKKRIAIFISGRGSNMLAIAKQCEDGALGDVCEIVVVFSNTPKAAGLKAAANLGLNTMWIKSKGSSRESFDQQIIDKLEPLNLDYIVLAGYMRIISEPFLKKFPNRIINIHPADTQAFKGLGAYEWAHENKLDHTYITVHLVDKGVDTGKVLDKRKVDLRRAENLQEVVKRGLEVEHKFYSEVLYQLFKNKA